MEIILYVPISSFSLFSQLVPVPKPFISDGVFTAGTEGNLTCNYSLSSVVDTDVEASASWTVNGSAVATSGDGRVSTDGVSLIFSPLTTSDTGKYTCTLTLTSLTPHVTVQEEKHSSGKAVMVYSKQLHRNI